MNEGIKSGIKRLFAVQLWLTLIMCGLFAVFQGGPAAYSAAIAGLVCILPNVYFAIKFFKFQGARAAKKIVNAFYKGEAMKLVLTFVLFALAFAALDAVPLPFFLTYIMVQLVAWVAPWIITN